MAEKLNRAEVPDKDNGNEVKREQSDCSAVKKEVYDEDEQEPHVNEEQVKVNSSTSSTTSTSVNLSTNNTTMAIDTRLPYRHGWPILPALPVHTTSDNVPKAFTASGSHLSAFRAILATHHTTAYTVEVAHRCHPGKPATKATLTLCIHSDAGSASTWTASIRALRTYITSNGLTLAVEIIDYHIVKGVFTLPVMVYDPLAEVFKRYKHGIVKVLDGCGEDWTSLDFYYRGVGPTRAECVATVMIGVPGPEKEVWWEDVVPEVRAKVKGKLEVEVVWREVVKY